MWFMGHIFCDCWRSDWALEYRILHSPRQFMPSIQCKMVLPNQFSQILLFLSQN